MATAKTVRFRWDGDHPVQTQDGILDPGGYLTVKTEDAPYFDALTGWTRAPVKKKKAPAKRKAPAKKAPAGD